MILNPIGQWLAMRGVCLLAALCLSINAARADERVEQGGFTYFIGETPTWIHPPDSTASDTNAAECADGIRCLSADMQVNATPGEAATHLQFRYKITQTTGVQSLTYIPIPFNPEFQTLTLHTLRIRRAGTWQDRLREARVEISRPDALTQKIVRQGLAVASVVPKDLRPGDELHLEYTLAGAHAIHQGQLSAVLPLGFTRSYEVARFRLLAPAGASASVQAPGFRERPEKSVSNGKQEWTFRMLRRTMVRLDAVDQTDVSRRLEYSTFPSWPAVSRWASQAYRTQTVASPDVIALADRLRGDSGSREDVIRRALKFVQDEIRYLSLPIGTAAYEPSRPSDVLDRRYGDCKDKSMLLVALLQLSGLDARPALVSSRFGATLPTALPGLAFFDHMIVALHFEGRTYWLDPTRTHQEGRLDAMGTPPFQWALVADSGGRELEAVRPAPRGGRRMDQTVEYQVPLVDEMAHGRVTKQFGGLWAELTRQRHEGPEALGQARNTLARFRDHYPEVISPLDLTVDDDAENNQITVTQSFRNVSVLTAEKGQVAGALKSIHLDTQIQFPKAEGNPVDIDLSTRGHETFTFRLRFPADIAYRPRSPVRIRDRYVEFSRQDAYADKLLTVQFVLSFHAESVPADAVPSFLRTIREIRQHLPIRFDVPRSVLDAMVSRDATPTPPTAARILTEQSSMFEDAVRAADRILADPETGAAERVETLSERARNRLFLGRVQDALRDADEAVNLGADPVEALWRRAETHITMGRYDRGIADFERAIAAGGGPFQWLGMAHALNGDPVAAVASLDQFLSEAPIGEERVYALVWRRIAAQKLKSSPAEPELRGLDSDRWPMPVARLFAGEIDVDKMIRAARGVFARTTLERQCEAYFFAGQFFLARGDTARAREYFRKSRETGVVQYVEHALAGHLLESLDRAGSAKDRRPP